MPTYIDIDDLARPRLSEAQQGALAWGESVTTDFSEEAILGAARTRTGLTDFGPADFRDRLRVLREEWDGSEELTGLQRMVLQGYLVRYASNRLLIHDLLRRHPEIRNERIERPVIVVGLPRSGTTHLVNLLAADRRFHSLPLWESYEPVPLPGEAPLADGTDPRYARCAEAWAGMQQTTPLIAAMHPMNPDHIHEELELMGPDFASYNFEWLAHSPRWRDYYYSTDQRPHYEYLKDALRIVQWRRGGPPKRWVLKCPQHLEQLPVLKQVFPDATIAVTHRDPVAVIQSTVTMQAYTQRIGRRHVALDALIEYWPARIEHLLRGCVRDRGLFGAAVSTDVYFHEFMADPSTKLAEIYARADLELDASARSTLERYLAEHPRGRDGQVRYHLERDFGVSPQALRRRFDFYFERFPVRVEGGFAVSTTMDLRQLADERDLWLAMGRYSRALDARDWGALDSVFAADAVAAYGGDATREGRAAIVASIRGYLDGCGPSQHLLGNFAAEVSGDAATSRTYVRVYHLGRGERAALSLETFGEYVTRWERRPEGWRVVHWGMRVFANLGEMSVLAP